MENIDKITLVWNEQKKWVRYKDVLKQINVKPELGFDYKEIWVDEGEAYKINGKKAKLSKVQMEAVEVYLAKLDLVHEKEVLGIDEKGRYLDRCSPYKCFAIVWDTPFNTFNFIWDFTEKKWKDAYPVNEKGEFILRNSVWDEFYFASADTWVPTHGPQKWAWNFEKKLWEDTRPLEDQKAQYREQVDHQYKKLLFERLGYDFLMENKYKAKYKESIAYRDAGYPEITKEYPYIYHEYMFTGVDAKSVASKIIEQHEKVDLNIHSLEGFRLAANKKINNATEFSDMEDAVKLMASFHIGIV